jgi:hypothetical protein
LEQDKLEANKKGKFQSCPTYSVNSTFSRWIEKDRRAEKRLVIWFNLIH